MKAVLSGGPADGEVLELSDWDQTYTTRGHEYRRAIGDIADDWENRGGQMLFSWVHGAPVPSAPLAQPQPFQFRRG